MNTLKIRKLSYTAIFFSLCTVMVMLQIPVYSFLWIEFSLIFLILCRRVVGNNYAYLIALIYPWFAMLSYVPSDPVGILALISLNVFTLTFDVVFEKRNVYFRSVIITILSATLMTFWNILFITPFYLSWDYAAVWQAFWAYFGLYMIFNISKVGISYIVLEPTWMFVKKHYNDRIKEFNEA